MHIKVALSLILATAAFTGCGRKAGSLAGTWKVTGMDIKPDSLVQPGMFDKEDMYKTRVIFTADSTITITDGRSDPEPGLYVIEKVGTERFLIIRPPARGPEALPGAMEHRMRIVSQTSSKLDLEQKFAPYTFTTHLELAE